jgi:hypothetical protein
MLKTLWFHFRRLDIFLDKHAVALALLLAVVFLRIPTLAEPYWYGDEAIYLTIGNSLRAGEQMYVDIIDHKTPLIYYFAAAAGTQFGFRLMTAGVAVVSTAAFFLLTKDFFIKLRWRILATSIFIAYTNLPRFEGNIPNGELYVMMFVLLALVVLQTTKFYRSFFAEKARAITPVQAANDTKNVLTLLATGFLFGLATLTKVPAIFDFAIVGVMAWFIGVEIFTSNTQSTTRWKKLHFVALELGILLTGWIVCILASVLYFAARGSLEAYIDFGLFYNFRYAGSWMPEFGSPVIAFFFTLKGKVLLLGSWILLLTAIRKYLTPKFIFSISWIALTILAATLSNRPYPHYFLQVFPAIALLIAQLAELLSSALSSWKAMNVSNKWRLNEEMTRQLVQVTAALIMIIVFLSTLRLLDVTPYPTKKYYSLFFQLLTKKVTWEEYRDQFNPLLKDNYRVAKMLRQNPEKELFIWGDNPLLYALTNKNPVGRFIVSFHIDDFKAHEESLSAVKTKSPTYVIVMKDRAPLPGLDEYLSANYIPNDDYMTFTMWRRGNP